MISLDQVALLEQKVESAVAKIQQLQAENDALRNKCAELTNALSAKSEQLSNFETDQTQIEDRIKKALDRLNSIENSVLKAGSVISSVGQAAQIIQPTTTQVSPVVTEPVLEEKTPAISVTNNQEELSNTQGTSELFVSSSVEQEQEEPEMDFSLTAPSFDTMVEMNSTNTDDLPVSDSDNSFNDDFISDEEPPFEPEDDSQDGLGFDIF